MSVLKVKGVEHQVADDVRFAVDLMEQIYGAGQGVATGHKNGPRVTYDFPRHGDAQVLVPLNRRDFSLYLRDLTRDGRRLSDLLSADQIMETYPDDGNAIQSLMDGKSPYLKPGADNRVLRVRVDRDDLRRVLDDYLGLGVKGTEPVSTAVEPVPLEPATGLTPPLPGKRTISADQLLAQLDRNSEIGLAGESVALRYELERLHKCGCPKPKDYVRHTALTDVGCGYDISSTWPGEVRCIEVKSTPRKGSDFFLTENERQVLSDLGDKAWLYRVVVEADGGGEVVSCLQDPIRHIDPGQLTPVVWRVASKTLES